MKSQRQVIWVDLDGERQCAPAQNLSKRTKYTRLMKVHLLEDLTTVIHLEGLSFGRGDIHVLADARTCPCCFANVHLLAPYLPLLVPAGLAADCHTRC